MLNGSFVACIHHHCLRLENELVEILFEPRVRGITKDWLTQEIQHKTCAKEVELFYRNRKHIYRVNASNHWRKKSQKSETSVYFSFLYSDWTFLPRGGGVGKATFLLLSFQLRSWTCSTLSHHAKLFLSVHGSYWETTDVGRMWCYVFAGGCFNLI